MTISSFASKSIVSRYIAPTMLKQGGFKITSAVHYCQSRHSLPPVVASLQQLFSTSSGTAVSTASSSSTANNASASMFASVLSNNEQNQLAVRRNNFIVWSPRNKTSVHADPFFGSLMTVIAYVIFATGTGTVISLCDEKDVDENLPEEDEETGSIISKVFRQGPCKDAFIKLERCMRKSLDDDDEVSEKCEIYQKSFKFCFQKNVAFYKEIAEKESAKYDRTVISLGDEKDVDKNLPEEDEETGSILFNVFRQGPCKDAFIKLERCMRESLDDDDELSEKCEIYQKSFKFCFEKNVAFYNEIAEKESAKYDGTVISLGDEKDVDKNLPEEDEETGSIISKVFRQGPCKDAFIKLERCMRKSLDDDDEVSEKCEIYQKSFKFCFEKNVAFYNEIAEKESAKYE